MAGAHKRSKDLWRQEAFAVLVAERVGDARDGVETAQVGRVEWALGVTEAEHAGLVDVLDRRDALITSSRAAASARRSTSDLRPRSSITVSMT
jgi:hypothetical protein